MSNVMVSDYVAVMEATHARHRRDRQRLLEFRLERQFGIVPDDISWVPSTSSRFRFEFAGVTVEVIERLVRPSLALVVPAVPWWRRRAVESTRGLHRELVKDERWANRRRQKN